MPTSNIGSFENGLRLILKINPRTILDVGPGFGTWGFFSRMYLDMRRDQAWDGVAPGGWSRRVDAVDAFGPYLQAPHIQALYDEVFEMPARRFFDHWPAGKSYDLVILSHVLEHMPKEDGMFILQKAISTCGNVLVGLPLDCSTEDRDPFFENEHERHSSDWADQIEALQDSAAVSFIEERTNLLAWIKGEQYEDRTPEGWVDKWRGPEYL